MKGKALVAGAIALLCASSSFAAIHVTQNTVAKYGMLDQNHESVNFGPTACGPTAVVNSFLFLQNQYGISGLVDADPYATINTLEESQYMDTNDTTGTTIGNLINGKRDYINDKNLGYRVSVEGETTFNLGIEGVADNTKPTTDFLFTQVDMGQDVEILINWWNGTAYNGGHYVTVTGMTYNDANNTGTLSFIDPWDGVAITGTIGTHNGYMQLSYSGGAAFDPNDPDNPDHVGVADISAVVAESPIPEPTCLTAIFGLGMLTIRRKRK